MSEWIATTESSHVEEIKYEPDTQDLFVRFSDDSIYQYLDVPQDVFQQLLDSGSKGRFINIVLRRRYRYKRVS